MCVCNIYMGHDIGIWVYVRLAYILVYIYYIPIYQYMGIWATTVCVRTYGVATISRLLKMIGLFCKRALQKRPIFCKETYIFKHPTNRSHPIVYGYMFEWQHRVVTATNIYIPDISLQPIYMFVIYVHNICSLYMLT